MADLCLKGGLIAHEEFLKTNSIPFLPSEKEIEEMCNKTLQEGITFDKKIMTECPDHDRKIERDYYERRIEMVNYCSKDSATGELCIDNHFDFKPLYTEWDSYQCKSSCLPEYDAILREYAKSPACSDYGDKCSTFKEKSNPLESCGNPNYVEKTNISDPGINDGKSTSDATALTSHVALFSLIMYFIFTIFSHK